MFLDPFIFTPPRPDFLTRAVESYQRVAAARFSHYARDAENPDLLPRKVRGDLLEPTPKQLHGEVRALRHLTAIQRTLRDIGGPLFNPDSPVPPRERFRLVERRMEAIEDALGAPSACSASSSDWEGSDRFTDALPATEPGRHSLGEGGSASSASSFRSSHPVNLVNPVDASSPPGDFELHRPRPGDDFYHPPEIEDLLEAVNYAQRVFAARAELLDRRRLELSPEDFLLEIASLRDLTAVIRTLRRMSAHRLPENQSHEDLQVDFNPRPEVAPALAASGTSPSESHESHSSDPSHSSDSSDSSFDASNPVNHVNPVESGSSAGVNPVQSDLRTRPVPRVPEVRPINNPVNGSSPPSSVPPRGVTPCNGSAPSAPTTPPASPIAPENALPDEILRPSDPSHSSHSSHSSVPPLPSSASDSEISNPKSEIPNPPQSPTAPVLHDKDPPSDNAP